MSGRDLADPELFGNEAGEDEPIEVLYSYFAEKEEFNSFYSDQIRLGFVRSRKGVGKSALLKQTLYKRQMAEPADVLLYVKASELSALQDIKHESPADLVYGWQQRMCSFINLQLGALLPLAISDDSITLVESAELAGFRGRNLLSSLLDRLNIKGAGLDLSRTRLPQMNSEALLRRITEKKEIRIWLFVDDIDATFLNNERDRLLASTFFSACRNLVSNVSGLNIRASVRTDVWSILAQYDEALDKCEQYMLDLRWSTMETAEILERKMLSYFVRYYPDNSFFKTLVPIRDRRAVYSLVFNEPFPWGTRRLEAFRPIHVLSAGRPRWAAQLCKMAGRDAFDKKSERISLGHMKAQMRDYGQARVSDLYKEHRHQCPMMQDILESFAGRQSRYSTQELLAHLTERVIRRRGLPIIDNRPAVKGSLTVAHFLYRIGFIAARDEKDPTGLGFVRYEDRPNLLTTSANYDDGMDWEIHPSYRQVLRISPSHHDEL